MGKRDFKQVFRGANPKGEIVELAHANGTHAVCCVITAHVVELVGETVLFFICFAGDRQKMVVNNATCNTVQTTMEYIFINLNRYYWPLNKILIPYILRILFEYYSIDAVACLDNLKFHHPI